MTAKQLEIFDVLPDFLHDSLQRPEYRLQRIDSKGYRYYAIPQDDDNYRFFISVTSLIQATTPTSPYLIKWMAETPNHKEYAKERADYGTLMHILFKWFMMEGAIDLDSIDQRLNEEAAEEDITIRESWYKDLKSDLLAFAAFCYDYRVEPLGIEVPLVSPQDGYGGTVDLICKLYVDVKGFYGEILKSGPNKGNPKETKQTFCYTAIVDFKSGRKGFYEAHEIQLEACRRLVQENFKIDVDKLYNFSPKDWRTAPDYDLKDQTYSVPKGKFEHLVAIAKIEKLMDVREITSYAGTVRFGHVPQGHFVRMDMNEFLKSKRQVALIT